MTEQQINPVFTCRYQRHEIVTKDTLQLARAIMEDLNVLQAALQAGYQSANVAMPADVINGLMLVQNLITGNPKMGAVVNPPVLSLEQLVIAARNSLHPTVAGSVQVTKLEPMTHGVAVIEEPLQLEGDLSGGTPEHSEPKVAVSDLAAFRRRRAAQAAQVPTQPGTDDPPPKRFA